ncbi:hypothetical protein FSP39_025063 [Pinctada imbricata]|uniref:Uncharacterized protein n=1 Tax=Pinctada imbricata TaxID=66713 RepID=A0AA88YW75_PINIB|nr:hypothetical protein FSP39_025063 [Pinctada imbricata]
MLTLVYLFVIIGISHVKCQTDSDAYIGDTGSCKDMLQGFINGQLASTLGTLQMENMRTEFMRSLKDKDSEIKALRQDLESLRSDNEKGIIHEFI